MNEFIWTRDDLGDVLYGDENDRMHFTLVSPARTPGGAISGFIYPDGKIQVSQFYPAEDGSKCKCGALIAVAATPEQASYIVDMIRRYGQHLPQHFKLPVAA